MFLSIENCTSRVNYAAILECERFEMQQWWLILLSFCSDIGIIDNYIRTPRSISCMVYIFSSNT